MIRRSKKWTQNGNESRRAREPDAPAAPGRDLDRHSIRVHHDRAIFIRPEDLRACTAIAVHDNGAGWPNRLPRPALKTTAAGWLAATNGAVLEVELP